MFCVDSLMCVTLVVFILFEVDLVPNDKATFLFVQHFL